MTLDARIETTTSPDVLDAVYRLRVQAYAVHGKTLSGTTDGRATDPVDVTGTHFVAWLDGRLAGAARLSRHEDVDSMPNAHWHSFDLPYPVMLLSRLVVAPFARGRGIAARLDDARLEAAVRAGGRFVCADASVPRRQAALLRRGFRFIGGVESSYISTPDGPEPAVAYLLDLRVHDPR